MTLARPAQTPLLYFAYKSPARGRSRGPRARSAAGRARRRRVLAPAPAARRGVAGRDLRQTATRQAGFDPGLTWIQIALPAGGDVARVERTVGEELAKVVRDGITEAELARSKRIVTAAFVRGLATIDGKASALGELRGPARRLSRAVRRARAYEAVTPADDRRVAADGVRSRAAHGRRAGAAGRGRATEADDAEEAAMRLERICAALLALLLAPGAFAQVRLPPYERVVLDNGAVLLLVPHHEVPIVAFDRVVRGGTAAEPAQRRGVAALTAALLERGAGGRDAKAFVEAVADVGGELSASPGLEAITSAATSSRATAELMVELLADMLIRPRFERRSWRS